MRGSSLCTDDTFLSAAEATLHDYITVMPRHSSVPPTGWNATKTTDIEAALRL